MNKYTVIKSIILMVTKGLLVLFFTSLLIGFTLLGIYGDEEVYSFLAILIWGMIFCYGVNSLYYWLEKKEGEIKQ